MTEPDPIPMTVAISALDKLSILAEATGGYHKKLTESGVSQDAADRMTEEYHTTLLKLMEQSMQLGAKNMLQERVKQTLEAKREQQRRGR